jgi:hypothetical protein
MSLPFKIMPLLLVGLTASTSPSNGDDRLQRRFSDCKRQTVSTPFCQDEELAASLRNHGQRFSGETIRNNSELKRQACILFGSDSNSQTCANYVGD